MVSPIKPAFHDTDILATILGVVECGLSQSLGKHGQSWGQKLAVIKRAAGVGMHADMTAEVFSFFLVEISVEIGSDKSVSKMIYFVSSWT